MAASIFDTLFPPHQDVMDYKRVLMAIAPQNLGSLPPKVRKSITPAYRHRIQRLYAWSVRRAALADKQKAGTI